MFHFSCFLTEMFPCILQILGIHRQDQFYSPFSTMLSIRIEDTRQLILNYINANRKSLYHRAKSLDIDFDKWFTTVNEKKLKQPIDILLMNAESETFRVHTTVYTQNQCWSTLDLLNQQPFKTLHFIMALLPDRQFILLWSKHHVAPDLEPDTKLVL